jgi:hypothetical protein
MDAFLHRHADKITGHLSGLDRIVIRGRLREIAYADGLEKCLTMEKVLLKDFPQFAKSMTEALVDATESQTKVILGCPPEFLDSPETNKEARALEIAKAKGITKDLICVLKSVEPCRKFDRRKNEKGRLELVNRSGKCAFFYHYGFHPVFGFMNVRIQTWIPFTIQVCLNGREWLARQMDKIGLGYERDDNTFTWVENVATAQRLLNKQWEVSLEELFVELAHYVFPQYPYLFSRFNVRYDWTVYQSEVATDVMFREPHELQQVYQPAVRQAIPVFGSADVIRFLGQSRVTKSGEIYKRFRGEVTSDYKQRLEGIRVKHSVNGNSVKVYDKARLVLRTETTINNPHDFKVMRPKEGGKAKDIKRRYLRKSLEDLGRRVETSRKCNERYLDGLATLSSTQPLGELMQPLAQTARVGKTQARGLNPHRPDDAALLRAVNRGEFVLNGFRNDDIRKLLHPDTDNANQRRRQISNVSRRLRLLRAHGLVQRVAGTHRYEVTPRGREILVAILAALEADTKRLVSAA